MSTTTDVVVVGQGLAGSLLVHALCARGLQVTVLDPGHAHAASMAAAGSLSPCAGHRYTVPSPLRTWLRPALALWSEVGTRLGTRLIRPLPLCRLFRDAAEAEQVRRRRAADATLARVLSEPRPGAPEGLACAPGHVHSATWQVDLPDFLDKTRAWLAHTGRLIPATLPDGLPLPTPDRDGWLRLERDGTQLRARALVLCQGGGGPNVSALRDLPWRLSRGTALYLAGHTDFPSHGVSREQALLPLGDGRYWLGASYARVRPGSLDDTPPVTERERVLAGLSDLLARPPTSAVLEWRTGVRPGSRTDAPFCAPLPNQPGVHVFNGLGSRGSLLGPRCALALAAHLADGVPLDPTWNPWRRRA
jgi:glycine/D-amino acid oxidase-like deaminating enzyme